MAELSNYAENGVYDHLLRNIALASPVTVYAALFTTDPTDAGSGTEVSEASYNRKAIVFDAPTDGSGINQEVIFDQALTAWGTVTHIAIYDAVTLGNMIVHTILDVAKPITIDDIFKLPAGNVTATFA